MRTYFDDSERHALLGATRGFVEEAATGREPRHDLPEELAGEEAFGVFTTLRRGGLLRSCIGHWPGEGRKERLGELLRLSARHAASRDTRFPSLHPSEMDLLSVELTVLSRPQLLTCSGEERAARIEAGRHGLILECGGRCAVLLPQVAAERGWDAETFLARLCAKAGVSTSAWRDPRTELKVFEASHFSDRPRRREITLDELVSTALPARLAKALEPAGGDRAGLGHWAFEFWTGILMETRSGREFWIRESGTLALLIEAAAERVAGRVDEGFVRRISLLSHAVPLRAADDPQRLRSLRGQAIWVEAEGDEKSLWVSGSGDDGRDPVADALRAAGVSRGSWLRGEARVTAFTVWPASQG